MIYYQLLLIMIQKRHEKDDDSYMSPLGMPNRK